MQLPSVMESYLCRVLDLMSDTREGDPIHQCDCDHLGSVPEHADQLLQLADEKLHVFPFKEVQSCWFRLYTDASIAKAVKLMLAHLQDADTAAPSFTSNAWIDETVAILDTALIMAGGLGREEMIHKLLGQLQELVGASDKREDRARKRRKLDHNPSMNYVPRLDTLPEREVSVPQLRFSVPELECPPLELLQKHMNDRNGPLVLTGILENWPALKLWKNTNYWYDHTLGGRRLVPVELGRSYVDEDWGQKIMPFRVFMKDHILPATDDSKDNHDKDSRVGYLAQHDLLKQIPSLHAAIATPDYCYLDAPPPEPGTPVALRKAKEAASEQKTGNPPMLPTVKGEELAIASSNDSDSRDPPDIQANIWFGPAWTISPLHHDPYHNILCQVVGKKYVRLYSPQMSADLHPRQSDEPAPHLQDTKTANATTPTIDMSNTSTIDVAAMELSPDEDWDMTYPGISDIPYQEYVLEAGQALYIPVGWWHYVRSCSVGISVSFWW
jgi:Cupin-like domain